jgi:nicotinamidase-related amidase
VQDASNSVFLVCDIQETFRDKMQQWPLLVAASSFLTKVAHHLSIPVLVTEQKPFKPTIAELSLDSIPHSLYPKTLFSMLTPAVVADLRQRHGQRRHVFLYGIEAHVCVLQTTLDLVREGYVVHLPVDAVTSMWPVDREGAMERYRGLASQGVVLTSAESCMFELIGDASKAEFKKMVPLVKELAAVKKKVTEAAQAAATAGAASKL